jgi:ABC-type uncharacterized transport system auxiliary subunit
MRALAISLALLAGIGGGCLAPGAPERIRYFRPEIPAGPSTAPAAPAAATARPVALRLALVRSATHVKDRIVWRTSDVELGFYDTRRWVEPPAAFVERALARELFEVRPLVRALGSAPSLDIEVSQFDEVLSPHEALVALEVLLVDEKGQALLGRRIAAARPVSGDDPAAFARAMGQALDDAVKGTAREVEAALRREPAASRP